MRPAGEKIRTALSDQERVAWIGLGLAMAGAAALILYFSRGLSFTVDELVWFVESPNLDLNTALQPHGGHLTLTARVVYKAMFEVFGASYLPFRLLVVATLLVTVGLFFLYARRRVGGLVALAPCLVLLVFGSDSLHVLNGNGFTVIGALGCGIGALLALERRDTAGDLLACGLLCLGLATYTVALGFVAAVTVAVLLGEDRWRRIWIPVVPTALYAAWWLWSLDSAINGGDSTAVSNILLFPSKAFEACSAVLGSLTGLDGVGGALAVQAGPTLTVIAVVALVWRLHRGAVPGALWVVLAIPIVLWSLVSVAKLRAPSDPRYLFPGAIAVLLVGVEAVRGVRWSEFALGILFAIALGGAATNVWLLKNDGAAYRDGYVAQAKAELTAIEIAGTRAAPSFDPADKLGVDSALFFPFAEIRARGAPPTASYLEAARAYGAVGHDESQVPGLPEGGRERVDSVLADALGLKLAPAPRPASGPGCKQVRARGFGVSIPLPRGGALLEAGSGGDVAVRRFASASIPVGSLLPGRPAALRVPADAGPVPWSLLTAASPLRICPLR
jgi:hypothetical protein